MVKCGTIGEALVVGRPPRRGHKEDHMSKHTNRAQAHAAEAAAQAAAEAEAAALAEQQEQLDAAIAAAAAEAAERQEAADDAEIDEQIALPASVVNRKYKIRYKERAKAGGHRSKAAKRSAWDWLAQELAAATLNEKAKLRVDDFLALLDANGVDHSRWTNRSPGWEGRLRMTGRLALQRVVAETGELFFADGDSKPAPEEWVAKYRN